MQISLDSLLLVLILVMQFILAGAFVVFLTRIDQYTTMLNRLFQATDVLSSGFSTIVTAIQNLADLAGLKKSIEDALRKVGVTEGGVHISGGSVDIRQGDLVGRDTNVGKDKGSAEHDATNASNAGEP